MGERNLAVESKRRAGRAVRARVREERLAYVRRNPLLFCALSVPGPVVLVGSAVVTANAFVSGVMVGLALALFAFGLWYPFVLNGSHARRLGGDAEGFTSEELRKLDGRIWRVVDDIVFDGLNVDHVLIGPGRVYAVETKWRSTGLDRQQLQQLARTATRTADKIRLLLRSEGLRTTVDALVVLWGPAASSVASEGERLDDVWFVPGAAAKRWRPIVERSAQGHELNFPVVDAVRRYVTRRDRHLAKSGRQ